MYLVLLEISDKKSYLFATNRLRENIGASELIYRTCTQFVLDAVKNQGGSQLWSDDPQQLRTQLRNAPQVEKAAIEIIIATSGKTLLLTKERAKAENIISEVTARALCEAPSLDVCGIISEPFDWQNDNIHWQIKTIHKQFEEIHHPQQSARFPNLPIAALCVNSGLPAQTLDAEGKEISATCQAKQKMAELCKRVKNVSQLEECFEDLSWLALVHVDSYQSKIFLDFDKHIGSADNRLYVNKLRLFSLALEEATEKAYHKALNVLEALKKEKKTLSIAPLILGRDEVTVICDGRYALEFTRLFLKAFEKQTTNLGIIPEKQLSAAAGVSITKCHFPFYNGYTLAEELCNQAKIVDKKTQNPCSAMDFHVLYDTSFTRLSDIRHALQVDKTRLTAKPYVVSENREAWAKQHSITGLLARIQIFLKKDNEGRRKLPNNQIHSLREGLFLGRDEANERLNLIVKRYPEFRQFLEQPSKEEEGLFRLEGNGWETRFLDALEAVDFWKEYYREDA